MDFSSMMNANYTSADDGNATASVYGAYFERQLLSGVTLVASFVGFLGNLAVIVAILTVKKLQTSTNVFVFNLAVADVLTCTVAPLQAVTILNDELVFPTWMCQVVSFGLLTCIGCSINTLTCIAVNRLVGITTKIHSVYRKLYTPCKLSLMIALSWSVPIAVAIIPLFSDYAEFGYNAFYKSCTWQSNRSYTFIYAMFVATVYFPVQFTIILISYLRIFLYVRKTTRSTLGQDNARDAGTGNQVLQSQLWKRQVAVTKNLFLVVCVFLLCISPYFLTLGLSDALSLLSYASTILIANSSVNPIIYGTKHPDFRMAFVRILRCRMKKPRQPQTQSTALTSKHHDLSASTSVLTNSEQTQL